MRLNALIKVWGILLVTWLHWLQTPKYRAIDSAAAAGAPLCVLIHACSSEPTKEKSGAGCVTLSMLVGWLVG